MAQKIINAILAAGLAADNKIDLDFCKKVAESVANYNVHELTINQIQEIVESHLMNGPYEATAKKYIIYRDKRDREREKDSKQVKTFNEIIEIADNNVNRENANINANTPAGMMMKFASETAKEYALEYLMNPKHAKAHRDGHIHIHDLDARPDRTIA